MIIYYIFKLINLNQDKLQNGINDHDLHIRRLQWELEQRQTQQKQCDEVEKGKETILSEIQEQSRILQSILPMLKDIRTVSLSLIKIVYKY